MTNWRDGELADHDCQPPGSCTSTTVGVAMAEDAKEAIDRYTDEHGMRRAGHDVATIPMDDNIVLLCPEADLDV